MQSSTQMSRPLTQIAQVSTSASPWLRVLLTPLLTSFLIAGCGGSSAPEGDNRTGNLADIGWDLSVSPTTIELVEGTSATITVTLACTQNLTVKLHYLGLQLPPPLDTFIPPDRPSGGPLPDPITVAARGAEGLELACTPARNAVATMQISAPIPTGQKRSSLAFDLNCFTPESCRGRYLLGPTRWTTVEVQVPFFSSVYGTNLLVNPSFDSAVTLGLLPTAPGNWRGDVATSVGVDRGITPRSAPNMLRFDATGNVGSTTTFASQQWQIVDVRALAADIAAGRVRADASAWFNRVVGDLTTDRRFDIRVLAFDAAAADLPAAYVAGAQLAVQAASIQTSGNVWQQAALNMTLPANTKLLLVEIYAFEDVVNDDGATPEFAGHYADDISLVLTRS